MNKKQKKSEPKKTTKKTAQKTTPKKTERISVNELLNSENPKEIGLGFVYKTKENLSNQLKDKKEKRALTRKMAIIKKAFDERMTDKEKENLSKNFLNSFVRWTNEEKPAKKDEKDFLELFENYKSLGNTTAPRKTAKEKKQELKEKVLKKLKKE